MTAAEILAAIDRAHPIDRERVVASMLDYASDSDLCAELWTRCEYGDAPDEIIATCRKILAAEESQEWEAEL